MGLVGTTTKTMNLTYREKLALLKTLVQLSICDHDFAKVEAQKVTNFMRNMGLSMSDFDAAKKLSDREVANIISDFTGSEKESVKQLWKEIIRADNKVTNEELITFVEMCEACDIDVSGSI